MITFRMISDDITDPVEVNFMGQIFDKFF